MRGLFIINQVMWCQCIVAPYGYVGQGLAVSDVISENFDVAVNYRAICIYLSTIPARLVVYL
jgi:hypothetical protein